MEAQSINFKLVNRRFKEGRKYILFALLFIALIDFFAIILIETNLISEPKDIFQVLMAMYIALLLFYFLFIERSIELFWANTSDMVIEFNTESISLENQIYKLNGMLNTKLYFKGFKGDVNPYHKKGGTVDGTDNVISFMLDNEKLEFYFLIE